MPHPTELCYLRQDPDSRLPTPVSGFDELFLGFGREGEDDIRRSGSAKNASIRSKESDINEKNTAKLTSIIKVDPLPFHGHEGGGIDFEWNLMSRIAFRSCCAPNPSGSFYRSWSPSAFSGVHRLSNAHGILASRDRRYFDCASAARRVDELRLTELLRPITPTSTQLSFPTQPGPNLAVVIQTEELVKVASVKSHIDAVRCAWSRQGPKHRDGAAPPTVSCIS
ncbi:hypothetical protein BJ165DRAFT_1397413 [Panaeolus papilionaceus]|nr:hypothetical protein BJ165DRAFT_1397413 [Panaeolus papilionaceus]